MSRSYGNLLVVGLLIIAALTGWGIVNAIREASQRVTAPAAGAATQVQQFFNPTPTIYPDSVTVVRQVRSLARLETVQYTLEKVIVAEQGQGLLGPLFGDRLLFVAHGQVIAGVDLSKLQPSDVTVSPDDGQVTVILPAAEIFVSRLDNEKSYVYDRQTGLLTKGDVKLEALARQTAEEQIRQGALEDGILNVAQSNAAIVVERLLRTLRFADVIIVVATPQPPTPQP
ncbi:MAG: DUF4230 domain-containing protein [Anaerolineales bacterium]|nr:DUF4230 domain-containing protein [Anaerolineales bacterium]